MASELTATPPAYNPRVRAETWFWCCVAVCVLLLATAIRPSTLWIDEGFSVWMASQRSVGAVTQALVAGDVHDLQMPLHLYWLWGWVQLFGRSEYSVRAANIPFAVIFVLALALTSRSVFRRRFAWIPLAISPFAWYYVNEARPYFMLVSFSTAATGAAVAWSFGEQSEVRRAPWILLPAVLFALLTHMLAAFLIPGLIVILAWSFRSDRTADWRRWRTPLIVFGGPTALVLAFYMMTLLKPSTFEGRTPSIGNFAIALYQHAGLDGLGPPKNLARAGDVHVFAPYAGWLAAGVLALCFVIRSLFTHARGREATSVAAAWGVASSLAIAAALGVHGVLLGRHMAALFPLLLFLLLSLRLSTMQCLALAAVWMVSDARLSWLPEYGKDDYRGAVRDVIRRSELRPGRIVWSGDALTAHYYGLELDDPQDVWPFRMHHAWMKGRVNWVVRATGIAAVNWDRGAAQSVAARDESSRNRLYVVLTKPDLYDPQDAWGSVTRQSGTRLASYRAFDIFEIE